MEKSIQKRQRFVKVYEITSNIEGLSGGMHDLIGDGNSIVHADHDVQILKEADWIVEMGPAAGADGGTVIAEGSVADIVKNKHSHIGAFLAGTAENADKKRSNRYRH